MNSLHKCITGGVDVDSKYLQLSIRKEGKYTRKRISNTDNGCQQVIELAQQHGVDLIVFEATGNYSRRLSMALSNANIDWAELNPRQVRDLAKGLGRLHKTDKADADLLADLAFLFCPKSAQPRSQVHLELRDISRQIFSLTEDRANIKKRLKVPMRAAQAVQSDKHLLAFLHAEIKRLERVWLDLLGADSDLAERYQLVRSVGCIGAKSARVFVSELPADLERYGVRQLVAYCGPAPRDNASGDRIGRSWIPRSGNAFLHKTLHMPALVGIRHRADLRDVYNRITGQGKHHLTALTAVARQLASEVAAVLKRGSPWFATAPGVDKC